MLVAISNYTKPLAEVDVHRAKHHAFLRAHFESGKLLASGRQSSQVGGVIITKSCSRAEFEQILSEDPFVEAGVSQYQITEFSPSFVNGCLEA